jgi:hypothetical protein
MSPPLRFALLLALAALPDRAFAAPPPPAPAQADPRDAELRDFSRWLARFAKRAANQGNLPPLSPLIHLVEHPGAPVGTGPLIELAVDKLRIEGKEPGAGGTGKTWADQLARLDTELPALIRLYRLLHPTPDAKPGALLAVDRETPWAHLVDVAHRLSAQGYRQIQWLFVTKPAPGEPPGPSAIDERLERIRRLPSPFEKAKALTKLTQEMLTTCPSTAEVFAQLADIPPEQKLFFLSEQLPKGVAACPGDFPLASLKALLSAVWGAPSGQPAYTTVTTWLSPPDDGRPQIIQHPPRTPWSRTHRALLRGADHPVTLRVAPAKPSGRR